MDSPPSAAAGRCALVLGAGGFIGAALVARLRRAGWRVRCVLRPGARGADPDAVQLDLAQALQPEHWRPHLQGVDVVVNAAGILRERGRDRFGPIHEQAPLALAQACVQAGVSRFVQISALGDPRDGEFIASKQRFDAELLRLPLPAVVLRPSVVYSVHGSYGGTSLLRALAAAPLQAVPGAGGQRLQPLVDEDLAELVLRAVQGAGAGVYEVGGPEAISLRDYLRAWRDWLRLPPTRPLRIPLPLAGAAVAMAEKLGRGPMNATIWRLLQRGNVCAAGADVRLREDFGFAPRALAAALAERPCQVQDRWQARLYLLAPMLKLLVVTVFLCSAWVGWRTPVAQIEALAADSALAALQPVLLARTAAGVDLLLALGLLLGSRPQRWLQAMFALVALYTLAFGLLQPALWLDPLGGLLKNLLVLPALAVLWVLLERR